MHTLMFCVQFSPKQYVRVVVKVHWRISILIIHLKKKIEESNVDSSACSLDHVCCLIGDKKIKHLKTAANIRYSQVNEQATYACS